MIVERASQGGPFISADAGETKVQLVSSGPLKPERLGFLEGKFVVPDDFDRLGEEEVANMFEG